MSMQYQSQSQIFHTLCVQRAEERGYVRPRLVDGKLYVNRGTETIDYVEQILSPQRLIPEGTRVESYQQAYRLLGMTPACP